jgi:dihydroneopterin aldolase
MRTRTDHTRIFLENIVVEIAIGFGDWEKAPGKKWPVRIDVEMTTARTAWQGVSIDEIVDYGRVHGYLQALSTRPHVEFMETVAEDILDFCLQDEKVSSARVRIAKPHLYPNEALAGIELRRHRNDRSSESGS